MATVFANISTVGKGLRDFKNLSFDSKIWSEFKEKTANYFSILVSQASYSSTNVSKSSNSSKTVKPFSFT